MSAHRYTDWQIRCNWPGCISSVFASELEMRETTATATRKILRRRGWKINVPPARVPSVSTQERALDFCPAHAQQVLA